MLLNTKTITVRWDIKINKNYLDKQIWDKTKKRFETRREKEKQNKKKLIMFNPYR